MFWNRSKKTKKSDQPSGLGKTTPITKKIPFSFFQGLVPVGDMPDYEIQQFELRESRHVSGDVIFDHDEDSYSVPYLLKGQCYVETLNGSGYLVKAGSFKALYPLSNGQLFQCNVIAKSKVTIVHFPANILSLSGQHIRNPLLNSQDIPENLVDNPFFDAFCRYFNEDKLIIPSLPNVAIKLREAIQKDIGIHEAVKIINLDSVISSRLIQIVNSPMYRSASAISSSLDAVSRLGLNATRNLVTSICMKNLFRSTNKEINLKIHGLWKRSIHVSSISYTLATLAKSVSPDEALLAGLTHNIGAIPILIFADGLTDSEYSAEDLAQEMQQLIEWNDGDFKYYLDRYKYADRYPEHDDLFYREKAERFITELENRLSQHNFLCSDQCCLADMAIFPFIRQFANVNGDWFQRSKYKNLNYWLNQQIKSDLFNSIMEKYPAWKIEDNPVIFHP